MVSSMGARALPPLYQTETGKNVGSRLLALLDPGRADVGASRASGCCDGGFVGASNASAIATPANARSISRRIGLRFIG